MFSNLLFNPGVNRFLTKLDDEKSMFSIAIRDGVDNAGRTYMEWKRSPDGGRERLLEEFLTMIVWGFGIKFLQEKVYDPLMQTRPMQWAKVRFPGIDMDILDKEAEKLALRAERHLEKAPLEHKEYYKSLAELAKSAKVAKPTQYYLSHASKFLLTTGIPVFLIGFGIPTLNQWLTSRFHSQRQQQAAPKAELTPEGIAKFNPNPAGPSAQTAPHLAQQWGDELSNQVKHLTENAFHAPYMPEPAAHPYAMHPQLPQAYQPFHPSMMNGFSSLAAQGMPQNTPFQPMGVPAAAQRPPVMFGNLLSRLGVAASHVIQNERINTLFVDGTISGGRTYKARNWIERTEIIFREMGIIFFLFFAQRPIQNFIGKIITKLTGAETDIRFHGLRHIKETYLDKGGKKPAEFLQDINRSLNELFVKPAELKPLNMLNHLEHYGHNLKEFSQIESTLERLIDDYFLTGKTDNLLLEAAKECGWIKTLPGAEGKQMLDLTRKIDYKSLMEFAHGLQKIEVQAGKKALKPLLQQAMAGRVGALLLANAVCALFLSYLLPKAQHYITFMQTGKDYFPGLEPLESENTTAHTIRMA